MKDELFDELTESLREGGSILRGDSEAARQTEVSEPDVGTIRAELGLSQARFAAMLGISVRTLQNWEQGRRHPQGPARVLLYVAARYPQEVLDTVRSHEDLIAAAAKVVPLFVPGVETDLSRDEIVAAIREGREREK